MKNIYNHETQDHINEMKAHGYIVLKYLHNRYVHNNRK